MSLEEPHRNPRPGPAGESAEGQQLRRIGLFGGTFDPPHLGHLVVAETVRDTLGLDEVRLVVANHPWQKTSDRTITDADIRVEMVRVALDGAPNLAVSGVEIALGGPSYSIVTLEHLRRLEPNVEWFLIVGADAAAGLDTWHRAEELAAMVEVVVVNRPTDADAEPPPGWRWQAVTIPPIGISSTDIRARVAEGRSIRFLTPDPVAAVIERDLLYRQR